MIERCRMGPSLLLFKGLSTMTKKKKRIVYSPRSWRFSKHIYTIPLLQKMHYVHPLFVNQLYSLRDQAMNVVVSRLSQAELPLGRKGVEYMLDHDSHMWSMRRSKANFFRLMSVLFGVVAINHWVESIHNWHKLVCSALFVAIFQWLVCCPELIIPIMLLFMALMGLRRYRSQFRHPPHMDTRLSCEERLPC